MSRRNELFDTGYALDSNNFGKAGGWLMAIMVSVATLAVGFLMDPVNAALPKMPESLEKILENMVSDGPLWVSLLSVSVMAPFFEEWLCRGMILRGLLRKMHPVWAMVISSFCFALIHLNPWQGIPAFVLGMLFAYVYYKTGSLHVPDYGQVAVHFTAGCESGNHSALRGHCLEEHSHEITGRQHGHHHDGRHGHSGQPAIRHTLIHLPGSGTLLTKERFNFTEGLHFADIGDMQSLCFSAINRTGGSRTKIKIHYRETFPESTAFPGSFRL